MNSKKLFALDNNFHTIAANNIADTLTSPQGQKIYWIPAEGVNIQIKKMPNRFHRFMVKLFFGWTFETKPTEGKQMLYG
jgi:hypothetical protein